MDSLRSNIQTGGVLGLGMGDVGLCVFGFLGLSHITAASKWSMQNKWACTVSDVKKCQKSDGNLFQQQTRCDKEQRRHMLSWC